MATDRDKDLEKEISAIRAERAEFSKKELEAEHSRLIK